MDTTKIIKGVVNSGRYTVTAPIVKENYGIYLQIEGAELPETYQVDFSNDEHHGTSVTMIGNADGVKIPRQFIDTGKDVFAFLYWVGDNYGKTVYKFRIPNKVRPDRTDDTPTPEQASAIDQAISALNSAVAQTAQDVIDADASAQSASQSAENAHDSAVDAQNYAESAQTSANNASASASQANTSATASAQSASQSAQIKADVEDLADDAQGYAQASAQSASASANSASQAQGFAQSASASAQSASGYASNAQTSANTASTKASEASTSAQTASQKAAEASQSASQALGYKTDAESAKTASQTAQGLAESARDTAVQAKTDAESARDEAQNIVDGISAKAEQIDANTASVASLEEDRYKPYVVDSASGSIASFSDGADDIPLKSLIVDINPVQDLSHGDPSPENICPISGWTKVGVYDDPLHGGNIEWNQLTQIIDADYANKWISSPPNYTTITVNDDTIVCTMSDDITQINLINNGQEKRLVVGHKYLYSVKIKSDAWASSGNKLIIIFGGFWVRAFYPTDNVPTGKWFEASGIWTSTVANELQPTVRKYRDENNYPFEVKQYMIFDLTEMFGAGNEPSTVEEFKTLFPKDYYEYNEGEKTTVSAVNEKPYTHVTIDLGQTVYGGKLDVLSGVLTIDRAMVDIGAQSWAYTAVQRWFYNYRLGVKSNTRNAISSMYAYKSTPDIVSDLTLDNVFTVNNTSVCIRNLAYADATEFKAAMSGVQLCYELAEPIEIQLSANQINSLYGVNNLWADSGDTTCVYRADTKAYIAKKIAEAIASLT